MKGHMPKEGLEEIHGFLKPGGFFVTAMRMIYYEPEEELGYYGAIQDLLKSNKFRIYDTYTFDRGLSNHENPLFKPQKSHLFVFQKC